MTNIQGSKHFEAVALQVACGKTIAAAAHTVHCAPNTAYQLSRLPEFQRRVAEIRSQAVKAAVGVLTNVLTEAVETLAQVMRDDKAKPAERIAAAKVILGTVVPLSEFGELRERLDRIEHSQQLKIAQ